MNTYQFEWEEKIKGCGNCPLLERYGCVISTRCLLTQYKTDVSKPIPKWCPLKLGESIDD